jgi:acetolactate synthase-1/2/3 large subunit
MRWRDILHNEPHPARPQLIRIDIDPRELERFPADVRIEADSAVATRALVRRLERQVQPNRERRAEIVEAKRTADALIDRIQPQTAYLKAIRAVLPRDGILVPELSQAGFTTYTGAFPVLAPRTYISEGYQGTLGFGFPTALGVKVANPEKAVVSITGDGGFMFGLQELATAAQYRIALVTIVFNNRSYGNVLRDQQVQFGGRTIGARLENPDFVRLAEAFGVHGRRAADPAALQRALADALALGQPVLIEVSVEPGTETSPWSLIHMRTRPSRTATA